MKLIDTHAHLEDFTDIELVLKRAKDNNVLAIIAVGSNKKSNLKILELKKQYIDLIYSAIGIHPIEAEKCEAEDINFVDAGNLDLPPGHIEKALEMLSDFTKKIIQDKKMHFMPNSHYFR